MLFLVLALSEGCATGGSPAEAAGSWAEGPARWLLLPDEFREIQRLRDDREVLAAIDRFWLRRDPDRTAPGNPSLRTFTERVTAADSLYADGDRRGSLTPRGRALILLGPPPALRYNQRQVQTLQPRRVAGEAVSSIRIATLESWIYGPDDLSPELQALLAAAGRQPSIALLFEDLGNDRARLVEGQELLGLAARSWVRGTEPSSRAETTVIADLDQRLAKYSPVPLVPDLSALSARDREALAKLNEASALIDEIFLRQAWAGGPALREELSRLQGPRADLVRDFFALNFGPWDRLDERKAFLGEAPHPQGAGFYPEDLTREEFEDWLAKHPEDREAFTSGVTVIRREAGRLVAIPYSKEYRTWLEPAAHLLREAAALTENASLAKFLRSRAAAFLTDDYFPSDVDWMDLNAPVEVTIGPYETYEDELFGYKAAFEAYVTVNLPAEAAELARFKERLPWLERNLPIPDEIKNLDRGTESPIRVVDVARAAGDARAGVPAIAFNLPNDERVREAKGSKKVLLRNLMRAKYERILVPIAERVLVPGQVPEVTFDAYLNEVLHHELSHGLGPGTITKDGKKTEVRLELKELFSTIEEAKADVMGVYNILALIDQGEMPAALRSALEPTYVAGLFRSARFGVDEAHGQGVVAQFNYLLEKGALSVDGEGRFRALSEAFPGAIRELLHDLLILQANGDYQGTKAFLERYGNASPVLRAAIDRLAEVPVDIRLLP